MEYLEITEPNTVPFGVYFYNAKGEPLTRPPFGLEKEFYPFLADVFCVQIIDSANNRNAVQEILNRPIPHNLFRFTGNDAKLIAANITLDN